VNSPPVPALLTRRPHRSCRPYLSAITLPLGSDPSAARFAVAHSHACRRTSGPALAPVLRLAVTTERFSAAGCRELRDAEAASGATLRRPRPGAVVGYHTRIALRELGRRAEFPGSQILCLDALIVPLVTGPRMTCRRGSGPVLVHRLAVRVDEHLLEVDEQWPETCLRRSWS
jgi:hypothetical protein